jgi:hypothetical protein
VCSSDLNCAKYGRMIGKRPKKYVRWRSFKGRKKAENCENVYWGYYDKAYGFSVRCLQENLFFLLEGLA